MLMADSSVWIDFFNGRPTASTEALKNALGTEEVVLGDLILMEVLQGFKKDADYKKAQQLLGMFPVVPLVGQTIALQGAMNFRKLRKKGITVRKTIDVIIATHCITHSIALLYSDRDFDVMVRYLGLKNALPLS